MCRPPPFLRALRALCDEHGILLILDEVQTGFGRTGKFFCYEHAGIEPDILVMAKGLGSGMPISAVRVTRRTDGALAAGRAGGTYGGGNAVAAAAAITTIDAIAAEQLVDNAALMSGARLKGGLLDLQAEHDVIGDVRGLGLMVGVEFTRGGQADAAMAAHVQQECIRQRLAAAHLRHVWQCDTLDTAFGGQRRADRRGIDHLQPGVDHGGKLTPPFIKMY